MPQQQPWRELRGLHRGDALPSFPWRCVFSPSWIPPQAARAGGAAGPGGRAPLPALGLALDQPLGTVWDQLWGEAPVVPQHRAVAELGCSDPSNRCWACLQTGCASALCRASVTAVLPLTGFRGVSTATDSWDCRLRASRQSEKPCNILKKFL